MLKLTVKFLPYCHQLKSDRMHGVLFSTRNCSNISIACTTTYRIGYVWIGGGVILVLVPLALGNPLQEKNSVASLGKC